MEDIELFFRIMEGILFLHFSFIRGYFSYHAKKEDPTFWRRRHQSAKTNKILMVEIIIQDVLAIGWFMSLIFFIFYPNAQEWAIFLSPNWLRYMGIIIGVCANWILHWTHHTLGKYWTAALEIRNDHQLIMHGPYKHIRHPMYSASIWFMTATGVVAANWFILVICGLTGIILYLRIFREETMLIAHFGNQYQEYMKRTFRLIPKL